MVRLRQTGSAEQELIEAERGVLGEQARRGRPVSGCPSDAALWRFAAGHEKDEETRERILIHLAACSRCVQFMAEIREQKIARPGVRSSYVRESIMATAALVIVAVGVWVWNGRHREVQSSEQLAIVDLRLISPTRGDHPVPGPAAKVPRQAGRLRLILPVGSEGSYEAGIFRQPGQGTPLLHASGHTNLEDHDVVLVLQLRLTTLQAGRYWLGFHQVGSDWAFFPLSVE